MKLSVHLFESDRAESKTIILFEMLLKIGTWIYFNAEWPLISTIQIVVSDELLHFIGFYPDTGEQTASNEMHLIKPPNEMSIVWPESER